MKKNFVHDMKGNTKNCTTGVARVNEMENTKR